MLRETGLFFFLNFAEKALFFRIIWNLETFFVLSLNNLETTKAVSFLQFPLNVAESLLFKVCA